MKNELPSSERGPSAPPCCVRSHPRPPRAPRSRKVVCYEKQDGLGGLWNDSLAHRFGRVR